MQEVNHSENYYQYKSGARLVHLPSLTVPRDIEESAITEYIYADSEGGVLDVYTNCVIVRGLNFIDEKYVGVAQYLLDTTPITISAKEVETVTLSSISATKTTTSYNVGDTFVYSDIVVTATYSNGTTSNVTTDATIDTSNVNMASANTFTVPISYTEDGVTKTTSISITVSSVEPTPTVNPTVVIDMTMDGSIASTSGYSNSESISVNDGKGTKKSASSGAKGYVTYNGTSIIGKTLYYRIVGNSVGLDYENKVGLIVSKYSGASTSGTYNKPDYCCTSAEWEKLINEDGSDFVLDSTNNVLNVFGKASLSSTATFPHTINARIQVGYVD